MKKIKTNEVEIKMFISKKYFICHLMILFVVTTFISNSVFAQAAQEVKWLRVGSLHSWYSSFGSELESGRTGRAEEQLDGLRWDAQYRYQDTEAAKAIWIGTTNYFDRFLDIVVPHKVVSVGTRLADPIGMIIPTEFKMIGRFNSPNVIVDGVRASDNVLNDVVDEVDETLPADRMIVNTLNSSIGLSYTRKLMAFSQQNHDNYFIYDYTFKNTGIYDINGNVEEKTLTGVYVFFVYRYGFGNEPFKKDPEGWAPSNNITWGKNAVNHQIGTDPSSPDFDMRAQYTWYGRHSQKNVNTLGLPYLIGDGHLGAQHFVGTVTLHADKSAADNSDDLTQPITTHHTGSDTDPNRADQFDVTLMSQKYDVMTRGHAVPTHAESVGEGFGDTWGGDPGGYAQGQGFGPYDLTPSASTILILSPGAKS